MSPFALGLVVVAAILHATWNVFAKRASGGVAFIWLSFAISVCVYAPFAIGLAVLLRPQFGAVQLAFIAGNGALHLVYFVLLQRGYRSGDLSVVYPLARGTGPLLTVALAAVVFHERLSPVALGGALFVAAGIYLTASKRATAISVGYGIATGASIAAYTLWDKESVAFLAIQPLLYDFGGNMVRFAMLSPFVVGRRTELAHEWRVHRAEAAGIAVLSPLAYLLVLWALISTPVIYIAPAREMSILIGTLAGTLVFREQHGGRRFVAAAVMLAGIAGLAAG
ncbi:MAG: EamA family transporter [Candidatus Velthaea sp.]